jgi:hypothetical protein
MPAQTRRRVSVLSEEDCVAFHRTVFVAGLLLSFAASAPADAARKCVCGYRKAKVVAAVGPVALRPWNVDIVTAGDPEDRIKKKLKDPFWVLDFIPGIGQNRPLTP